MSELVKLSDQFGGLPMDKLISASLSAACDSQITLAKATLNFIETVAFVKDADGVSTVRMVPFSFEKPEEEVNADGYVKIVKGKYTVNVPFIAIVTVPTLQVTDVSVNFMMEVKSSFSEKEQSSQSTEFGVEVGVDIGWLTAKVSVSGSVASSKETQRQSDNSAKYDVTVKAMQAEVPEGLSRVLDILQQVIAPVPTEPQAAG